MNALQPWCDLLVNWLVNEAYPLWSRSGVDRVSGGFVEALDQQGSALVGARRARVHPRQVFAFSQAPALGWHGEASSIVDRGMNYFIRNYRRADGFYLTLAGADGSALDTRALLYDQAFVLLGYAAAAAASGTRDGWERRAVDLRNLIDDRLKTEEGAFRSEEGAVGYETNPHMHLLEAYIAWAEIGQDLKWIEGVSSLVELTLGRFIRSDSGAVGEFYSPNWQPAQVVSRNSIEPGHQFEWAWLLLRCRRWLGRPLQETALRLIAIAELHGVSGGIAINALCDDLTVHDAGARLWPQCERLKAVLLAAEVTGEQEYRSAAQTAASSICQFLSTKVQGLWYDVQSPTGELQGGAVPASTFYHLVGAIAALRRATRADSWAVICASDAPAARSNCE